MKHILKYIFITFAVFALAFYVVIYAMNQHNNMFGQFMWRGWALEIYRYEVKPWLTIILLVGAGISAGRLLTKTAPLSVRLLVGLGVVALSLIHI